MSATWTRKTDALKYGAQFQSITVEIKERFEHRIRQSDLPTKPPTDRHSTNFTKDHKSLKSLPSVKLLMSGISRNLDERNWPIYIAKKSSSVLKKKLLQKVLVNHD